MFVTNTKFERLKDDLAKLYTDFTLMNEKVSSQIQIQKKASDQQSKKMDELIGIIKESYDRLETLQVKTTNSLVDRLTREYATNSVVDQKLVEYKNCVRREFANKEHIISEHTDMKENIVAVKDLAYQNILSLRREVWTAIVVASGLLGLYINNQSI